ncbi:MAG: carbon monoxide dehydrogenase subunit G, partial [Methylococcales bacterium]|nr:carbon monoxide dehydrogenase subunit G [Methylococcales bacterium]
MKLEGEYTFNYPKQAVWDALQDPAVLASVMPGCEKLEETGKNQYLGIMKIRMGTLSGKFKGQITLTDLNPPNSYGMKMKGSGSLGRVDGEGTIELVADGDNTTMRYDGDARVSGKLAGVGQRMMERSTKAIVKQSLDGLHKQVKARQVAATTG